MPAENTLRGHDLFSSLSVEETNRISGFSDVRRYDPGDTIFRFNAPCTHVFSLLEGSVNLRLPANPDDVSVVISKIEKGELFGLSPLVDSKNYTSTAVCNTYTEVLAIDAKPFQRLLRDNCPAGLDIMTQVAHIYFNRYINVLRSLQGVVNQIALIR